MNVSNARLYQFPTNMLKQVKFENIKKDFVFNHEKNLRTIHTKEVAPILFRNLSNQVESHCFIDATFVPAKFQHHNSPLIQD